MFQLGLAVSLAIAWQVPQRAAEPIWTSTTIREALSRSGFDDAVIAANPPDLDRRLRSSSFATAEDVFIAGYYFDDEAEDGGFGPLRVSRFDRATRRWTHAPPFRGDERGAVIDVQAGGSRVLVELHASPSASHTLVLDSSTLRVLTTVHGFRSRVMADGSIRFVGSMVHFAPTHQEKLMVLDATSGRTIEVFPGTRRSNLADAYREGIRAAYARVPESARVKYHESGYGPVDDFDCSLAAIADGNGKRIAFVTVYGPGRCVECAVPPLRTILACDREGSGMWTCDEQPLDEAARQLGVGLETNAEGRYDEHSFDALIQALLRR